MALEFYEDTSPADWIVRSRSDWWRLVSFGPEGFEAYARLRFIPDPTGPDQSESDADIADDHPSGLAQTQSALEVLRDFTTTPEDCYFSLWEGYSDLPASALEHLIEVPNRRFALLRGALADLAGWNTLLGTAGGGMPPAFVWPADHAWCFARDVDPHWAGIGASQAAINALIADAGLDVVPAQPDQDQPTYY